MHGHQLRLQADEDRAEAWADIKPGSLYGALGRLAAEGLIDAVRTERRGNYPERTVYEITADGWRELRTLHDHVLRRVVMAHDPFDLALAHARNVTEDIVRDAVSARLSELRARLAAARAQLAASEPWLSAAEHLVCEHVVVRLEGEIEWHERVLERIAGITDGPPSDREPARASGA